jgi:hypothetical protein
MPIASILPCCALAIGWLRPPVMAAEIGQIKTAKAR